MRGTIKVKPGVQSVDCPSTGAQKILLVPEDDPSLRLSHSVMKLPPVRVTYFDSSFTALTVRFLTLPRDEQSSSYSSFFPKSNPTGGTNNLHQITALFHNVDSSRVLRGGTPDKLFQSTRKSFPEVPLDDVSSLQTMIGADTIVRLAYYKKGKEIKGSKPEQATCTTLKSQKNPELQECRSRSYFFIADKATTLSSFATHFLCQENCNTSVSFKQSFTKNGFFQHKKQFNLETFQTKQYSLDIVLYSITQESKGKAKQGEVLYTANSLQSKNDSARYSIQTGNLSTYFPFNIHYGAKVCRTGVASRVENMVTRKFTDPAPRNISYCSRRPHCLGLCNMKKTIGMKCPNDECCGTVIHKNTHEIARSTNWFAVGFHRPTTDGGSNITSYYVSSDCMARTKTAKQRFEQTEWIRNQTDDRLFLPMELPGFRRCRIDIVACNAFESPLLGCSESSSMNTWTPPSRYDIVKIRSVDTKTSDGSLEVNIEYERPFQFVASPTSLVIHIKPVRTHPLGFFNILEKEYPRLSDGFVVNISVSKSSDTSVGAEEPRKRAAKACFSRTHRHHAFLRYDRKFDPQGKQLNISFLCLNRHSFIGVQKCHERTFGCDSRRIWRIRSTSFSMMQRHLSKAMNGFISLATGRAYLEMSMLRGNSKISTI